MYELFYNFLIEELLVRYFKKINVESGDKFYIVIEDAALRQDFYKVLRNSAFTCSQKIYFPGYEKYGIGSSEYDTVAFTCTSNGIPIIVSGCDDAGDGFQTMIRNNIGVMGNPISEMAALFILPGTNAIETLLSAGQNLQEEPYPLCLDSITKAIGNKIANKINTIEKEYLRNHVNRLRFQDDYTSLFDFAPVLSILQKPSLKHSFAQLDAFEDSEIYDNMFASTDINIKERVKDNTSAFSIISDMMNEAYDQDQYKRLTTYLDPKLAYKISNNKVDWRTLDYREIRKSHDIIVGNPTITRPHFKVDGDAELVSNVIGPKSEKISKNFVIVCDPASSSTTLKACFNKDLKDYSHGSITKVSGCNLVFTLGQKSQKDKIGDDKNYHEVSVLHLKTKNVFQSITHYFTIDANGNIVVNVPDSEDRFTIGLGANLINYDGMTPVELDDNSYFHIDIDHNATEEPIIPFKFGDAILNIRFKYKGEKTPTLNPSSITDAIWGSEEGGYTHDGDEGNITGTINGPIGPVYIHERFRKLVSLEKRMIDWNTPYFYIEKNEFCNEDEIKTQNLSIAYSIDTALAQIFNYFKARNTVPSFIRPDAELVQLYQRYIEAVHDEMLDIPSNGVSFSNTNAINISKLGVVEFEDGTIMLSPFHPLMVAYALQMSESIDSNEYNKKVIGELSPLYLMPYIYYGNRVLKAISSTETEDILTWVKYDEANNTQQLYGTKSTSKLVTEKIHNFIDNFKYYFPDADCPIRISAIGLSQSVDLVRGIVSFIDTSRKKGSVQRIEIHEYVEDILLDTFFEKLNRQSSRDNISEFFNIHNFNIADKDLNEIIRLLFSRVSYYKHTFKDSRKMEGYSHVTFFKINSGTNYTPLPAVQLRTETSLDGLVSIPSTNLIGSNYLMGFGTCGLKDNNSPIYLMAHDMNSLYAGLVNDGLSSYKEGQCTAKRYSFKDADFLQSVYDNSTWVTFVYPEVDIDFFYKQKNIYVVHYVEHHSISARLESITVTQHVVQYNKMLFNSLQTFKSIIGTSEDFSRKMISYFNCLNGKWLLDIAGKTELIMREKMSLVATCFVMKHFLNRTNNIIWAPIALDEIVRATGSIGMTQDGLFSKKDLGLDGPLSDDILMMGIRRNNNDELDVFFYPVEVKVLADDSVSKGEIQVVNLYNKALKEVLFKGDSFTRKVYRALFASHFLSNTEKMRANELMSDADYESVNESRYEMLNVKFNIVEELPVEIGKAALVVYSDATPKSLRTEWIDDVPVCHIRMMESDCYRIVANPDTQLLQFVEESAIAVAPQPRASTASTMPITPITSTSGATTSCQPVMFFEPDGQITKDENEDPSTHVVSLYPEHKEESLLMVADGVHQGIKIRLGKDRKGSPIIFEANNTTKISHPNMGVVGGMGFGKTQFSLSLIAQFAKESEHNVDGRPIGMLIFDYKGDDYSTEAFLKQVNGKCYSFNFPFNPLKLIVTDKTKFMNLPAVTADRISDSFAKAYGLGQVQQSTIKQIILETYQDFGITNNPSTWSKPQPTMSNVLDKYFEQYDAKDKTYALFDKLRDYMIFTPDNSECVSLFEWLDGVKVIDLTPYPGDTKKVIVSLILDLFYEEMRQLGASKLDDPYRELRAMILVDEAHQFLNKDFNSFRNIISEGRMFGVGMVLSTQNLSDFKSAKQEYSQYILSWVILHLNNITKAEVSNIFGSNDPNCQAYVDIVSKADKFHGICKIGNEVKAIHTLPYYELIKEDKRFITKL
ncbi:MAG: hypothetical protein IKY31_01875 [Bacteroidaceae bacterium]|nr:hypothetical protein [Bacteroidaceae bacterium]